MTLRSSGSGHSGAKAKPAERPLLQQIMQLTQRGSCREALLVAERALQASPRDAELLNVAAIAAIQSGEAGRAETWWQQCVAINPKMTVAQLNLARFYINSRQHVRAEPHLKKILQATPAHVDALVCLGAVHQAASRVDEAVKVYRRVLALEPGKADAWNNLGLCWLELKRFQDADECFRRYAAQPGFKSAGLVRLGMLAEAQGLDEQACEQYRSALVQDAANAIASEKLGMLLMRDGRDEEARSVFAQAMQFESGKRNAVIATNLAVLHYRAGERDLARSLFEHACACSDRPAEVLKLEAELAARAGAHDALHACLQRLAARAEPALAAQYTIRALLLAGLIEQALLAAEDATRRLGPVPDLLMAWSEALFASRQFGKACEVLEMMLAKAPSVEAAVQLARCLVEEGEEDQAEACLRDAMRSNPDDFRLSLAMAEVWRDSNRAPEALALLAPIHERHPDEPQVLATYASVLRMCNELPRAQALAERALARVPHDLLARQSLAACLEDQGDLVAAEQIWRAILEDFPAMVDVRFSLAHTLLAQGRFEEGWACYESRLDLIRVDETTIPLDAARRWRGENIAGQRLLVVHEQGLGDEIQFFRYVARLPGTCGCTVTLLCKPPLQALLSAQRVQGVDVVAYERNEALPEHDCWVLVMSLPHVTAGSIPAYATASAYLQATEASRQVWANRLASGSRKVGLVWRGNPDHRNDLRRSMPSTTLLAPVLAVPGISFFSLQKGAGEVEAGQLAAAGALQALGGDIRNVADTAAIISGLDLLICVDTMAAHLAGALGIPCWLLLPDPAEWRWMRSREDSPWYGSMRLYRQPSPGDWTGVIAAVTRDLQAWLLAPAGAQDD